VRQSNFFSENEKNLIQEGLQSGLIAQIRSNSAEELRFEVKLKQKAREPRDLEID